VDEAIGLPMSDEYDGGLAITVFVVLFAFFLPLFTNQQQSVPSLA
jgi:hypothetical protein